MPVELLKPEAPKPITDDIRDLPPVLATVTSASEEDKGGHNGSNAGGHNDQGPHAPRPGHDQVSNPWQNPQVDQFPTSPNIDVKGDNNTVTVINQTTNVYQTTNNYTYNDIDVTKIENRRDWMYLRSFDDPSRVLRFEVEHGRPVQLPPNWCGGQGGAWSYSGAIAGDNFAAAFTGSSTFYSSNGCGYRPPPPHPRGYPEHFYVCPPRGYTGAPVYQGSYIYINATTVYAPEYNTYYYGGWETRPVYIPQQRVTQPQQVFVPTGYAPDTVFQQSPIPGPPPPIKHRWGGFESETPPNPSVVATVSKFAQDHKPISIVVMVLIGAGAIVGVRSLAHGRNKSDVLN